MIRNRYYLDSIVNKGVNERFVIGRLVDKRSRLTVPLHISIGIDLKGTFVETCAIRKLER